MFDPMREHLARQLEEIRAAGLSKDERLIASPQGARIVLQDGRTVLNLCANNYLGLSGHPELIAAARAALARWGYGLSSVRFICGTQTLHKELERRVADFLGVEDAILYSSCFDANGGLFETLLAEEDAVISDELNHASIIDGIRLSKAQRLRYTNNDMADLEAKLREAAGARFRLIIGFSYPVVPMGTARVRVQMSAALDEADIDFALEKFAKVGRELGVIHSPKAG